MRRPLIGGLGTLRHRQLDFRRLARLQCDGHFVLSRGGLGVGGRDAELTDDPVNQTRSLLHGNGSWLDSAGLWRGGVDTIRLRLFSKLNLDLTHRR